MKRGCLISLFLWGACAYGYWYLFHARLVGNIRWVLPLVGGLIMALVFGGLRNAFSSARDAMRLSQGGEPGVFGERPQDGSIVTVSGHIRSGSPMRAPLSGRPAVLYTYDISHTVHSKNEVREQDDFSGWGLAGAIIDSPHGPMRLLGFPTLESFGKDTLDADTVRPNAEKYIVDTPFTDLSGFHPGAMYREIKELMTDDDGQLRKDWRMFGEPKPDATQPREQPEEGEKPEDPLKEWTDLALADRNYFEQIVAPGEQVSAIGRYSAEKGGLVPDMTHPLELLKGTAQEAASTMRTKMIVQIAGALFFAALVNGLAFGVFKLHKPGPPIAFSSETIEQNTDAMFEAAKKGDVAALEKLIKGGMPVDSVDNEHKTALMVAADVNTAQWLIAHGANVNAAATNGETALMRQAQYGSPDMAKLLIRSGANLEAKSPEWKLTALQLALDAEKLDVAQVLRDAGAKDETVTAANGKPLADGSEQVLVCRAYLDAVQREDRDGLIKLSKFGAMDSVDFTAWKKTRPASDARFVSGFANDTDATVVLRGPTPGGTYVTWTYQLMHKAEGWKISAERWETRLDSAQP